MTANKKPKNINPILSQLADISGKYPREEKILITPDYRLGRQVLLSLAQSGTPWMNFRMAAASALAHDVAEEAIISSKLKQITGPGILAIIDDIFNSLVDAGKLQYFERHETNRGIIHALTGVIMELRTKGIHPSNIREKVLIRKDKGKDLKLIFAEYEKYLRENRIVDKAGLTMLALDQLEKKSPEHEKIYIIFSRYYMSGLEREFIRKLAGDDLIVVENGPVFGLKGPESLWKKDEKLKKAACSSDIDRLSWTYAAAEAPKPLNDGTIEMFSATGFRNEIREIFRRIAKDTIPVDRVEIIHTDPEIYVREIFCLSEKLNIPATFAEGVPGCTRSPHRAIMGFLMWIKHDFTELYLRRLLEAEDIRLDDMTDGPTLGHLLRVSGVGWDRQRYSRILRKRAQEYRNKAEKPVCEEEVAASANIRINAENIEALKNLCDSLLGFVPKKDKNNNTNIMQLCRGCIKFLLEYARSSSGRDESLIKDIISRLEMIGEFSGEEMDVSEACDKLIDSISTIKVGASGPRPGHIHVSYYKQGGRSCRPNTFVIGLDESRFPGRGLQDPVLLDIERKSISEDMELSIDRTRKNVYDMASLLAGLRGKVTVSYSSFNVKEERKVFPASVMLQVYRLREGKPDADYDELLEHLGTPVSTTAGGGQSIPLDMTEWWIDMLSEKEVLKDGTRAVRNVYPGIKEGLAAAAARESDKFTKYDGKVTPDGDELDPRSNKEMVLSCSRLEAAAGCPHKYFFSTVLGIEKPEETVKDVASWLEPMQKGSLLHEVFESFTKRVRKHKKVLSGAEQKTLIRKALKEVTEKYRDIVPPPNDVVFEGEYVQLERDVEIFLNINEQLKTTAIYEELGFGTDETSPVKIDLGNKKNILLRGIIDRIDKAGPHEYHVWDYKTGSAYKYERRKYLMGGEQLQHALYAAAAEIILRESGEDPEARITKSGYLLPSEKGAGDGKGGIFARDPSKKVVWQQALNILFDIIAGGGFLMPGDPPCGFCNYSLICGDEKIKGGNEKIRGKQFNNKVDCGDASIESWKALKKYD